MINDANEHTTDLTCTADDHLAFDHHHTIYFSGSAWVDAMTYSRYARPAPLCDPNITYLIGGERHVITNITSASESDSMLFFQLTGMQILQIYLTSHIIGTVLTVTFTTTYKL
jgi:hypothetical protein